MATARKYAFKVAVIGAKELGSALENMGDQTGAIIDEAVRAGGDIALKSAKANAPEDSGKMARNITMQDVKQRKGKTTKRVTGSVKIGFNRTKKGAADDAYYGSFVELGTKYQKAKYFLRDAVDKNKQAISDRIISTIQRALHW